MGPPPKYVITRKLVRHFFKKSLPKTPIIVSNEASQLFDCWKAFGIDSPKCEEFEDAFNYASDKMKNYGERIKSMNFTGAVLSKLPKPDYKDLKKGRFQEKPFYKNEDIFNGLF